jgi:hypothetical protein
MNHEQYTNWIPLMLYGELNADEKKELKQHLQLCNDCQNEMETLQSLHATLTEHQPNEPSETMLMQARTELRSALRTAFATPSLLIRWKEWIQDFLTPSAKLAFGTAAVLAIGFFAGYFFVSPQPNIQSPNAAIPPTNNTFSLENNDGKISNIRFYDSDANDGTVEFSFDAVTPVRLRGNVNDANIQKILAYSLLNEENPGVRLRSVNAMATEQFNPLDTEIKDALITALTTDENPGVRREAFMALRKYPFDNQIKQAMLRVLSHDDNMALRIEAINLLGAANNTTSLDEDVLSVLKQKMQTDNNNYIRQRAKAVLQTLNK